MASKKIPKRPISSPPPDFTVPPRFDEPEDFDPETETNISRLLSQFGDEEITVKAYEQKENGEEHFLYVIPKPTPEKISEEAIRSRNRGRGGKFILRFLVGGELRTTQQLLIADDPNISQPAHAGSVSDPTLQLLLQEINNMKMQLMQRPSREPEPINDLADAMLKLQQLQGPKSETSLDTIMKCIELGKSLGGAGVDTSWPGIIKDIIKEVGPAVAPLLMASRAGMPAPQQTQLQAGPQEDTSVIERQLMKNGIDYLKKKCKDGSNPALYLEMIVDNAEEFPYSKLVHLAITQEFSAFTDIDPDLGQPGFEPFFRSIYDGLRSAFIEPDPVDGNPEGATGNTDNPSGDGAPGKTGSK